MILDAAVIILGFFGFDRTVYSSKEQRKEKMVSRAKRRKNNVYTN